MSFGHLAADFFSLVKIMALILKHEPAFHSCLQSLFYNLDQILRSKNLLSFWEIDPDQLKTLQREISGIQDVLNDAEWRIQERGVKHWMDNLIELCYDMEDIIDDMNIEHAHMLHKVTLGNQARTSNQAALHEYTFWDNIGEYTPKKYDIRKKISNVLTSLDKVVYQANKLGLEPVVRSLASSVSREVSGPSVDESEVYGRKEDKERIIELLKGSCDSGKKNYLVISIVGMGGLGKTTLAQVIFQDQRIRDCFSMRSWACVSDVFDVNRVMRELLEYTTEGNFSNMTTAALQRRLESKVRDEKILFVLDDVWTVRAWDMVKASFTNCARGSKILVTTRDIKVGQAISSMQLYELRTLEDEHCWILFKEKAFGEVNDTKLENLGKEIVKKCKGVPLAIKVMGSSLRFASEERWESVLRNELWQSVDREGDEIFPALKLSYHYLPSPLKRCFGYLSLFPIDYEFKKEKLVRLWIAEGLVEAKEGRLLEDIGNDYYEELYRRCLIQKDDKMHELVHNLACNVTGNFFYCMTNQSRSHTHGGRIRHLSFINESEHVEELLDGAKFLRTLLWFTYSMPPKWMDRILKWSLLRVLELMHTDLSDLPGFVGNLRHLRYLGLSKCYEIRNLPDSVCAIRHLQTLDLHCCKKLDSLPKEIGNLQSLRYLCLSHTSLSALPPSLVKLSNLLTLDLADCKDLTLIPEDIGDLQSLREFYLRRTPILFLPVGFCKLHKVQVLDLHACESLLKLPNKIGDVQDLKKLDLSGTSISSIPESICNLVNLQDMDISGCKRLVRLPEEIGNLRNMRNLILDKSIERVPGSIVNATGLQTLGTNSILSRGDSLKELPASIGKLTNLEYLEEYVVGKGVVGRGIAELKDLNKLKGSLTISHLENVDSVEQALEANLKGKLCICEVSYKWSPFVAEDINADAHRHKDRAGASLVVRPGEMEAKVLDALEPHPTTLLNLSFHNYGGERIPKWVYSSRFPSLKKLTMQGLYRMSKMTDVELLSLEILVIASCPELKDVSMALPSLEELKVLSCRALTNLSMTSSLGNFNYSFSFVMDLPQLKQLHFSHCTSLEDAHMVIPKLKSLEAEDCGKLKMTLVDVLPSRLKNLMLESLPHHTTLGEMRIYTTPEYCSDMLSQMTSLKTLGMVEYKELEQALNLREMTIKGWFKLTFRQDGLYHQTCLCIDFSSPLEANCSAFLGNLSSLQTLEIGKFAQQLLPLDSFPSCLDSLRMQDCPNLACLPKALHSLVSLREINIINCPQLVSFDEEGLPSMLVTLMISSCLNLKYLPKNLYLLASLQNLWVYECPRIQVRPDDRLPPRPDLELEIIDCPKLMQQLKDDNRDDWLTRIPL